MKCARSFSSKNKRSEINKQVSETLKRKFYENNPLTIELNCSYCKEIFIVKRNKKYNKYCSPKCSGRVGGLKTASLKIKRSKNEVLFSELCKSKFINVFTNKPMFNGWDADIIIEDIKVAVLWNGKWHYEKITHKHSLEQVQNRDIIKIKEIEKSGYISYIIKDLGSYNIEFVEKEFEKFIAICPKLVSECSHKTPDLSLESSNLSIATIEW